MNRICICMTSVLALTLAVGCEKDGAKTEPENKTVLTNDPPAPEVDVAAAARAKAMDFRRQIADAVNANKRDCDAMADAVATIIDANAEFAAMIKKMRENPNAKDLLASKEQKEFHKKMGDEHGAAADGAKKKIGPLYDCMAKSEKLTATMAKMGTKLPNKDQK